MLAVSATVDVVGARTADHFTVVDLHAVGVVFIVVVRAVAHVDVAVCTDREREPLETRALLINRFAFVVGVTSGHCWMGFQHRRAVLQARPLCQGLRPSVPI